MFRITVMLFVMLIISCWFPALSKAMSGGVVYVAGDGTGDYNCDGQDDQVEINAALEYVLQHPEYHTVYLKGPFTYVISDSVVIGSDTTLTGDSTAVLKLADRVNWPTEKAMITNKKYHAVRLIDGDRNITIMGFEINGNRDGNPQVTSGKGYHNLISLRYCTNVDIHHMYLHNNHGDGLKFHTGSQLKYHDNVIYRLGHDGLYAIRSNYVEAYNNTITTRTNSGLRVYNTNHVSLHDNIITSQNEGGSGIEVQKESAGYPMDDIKIYNNTIDRTNYAGIWIFGHGSLYPKEQTLNLHIYNNKITNAGVSGGHWVGGIVLNGFHNVLIENNIFDGCYGAAIAHKNVYSSPAPGSGYVTLVRNNIIKNTRPHPAGGPGVALYNNLPETHNFISENNCICHNPGGPYINASSTTDIIDDPSCLEPTP